ncbi:MAG: C4-dicarboxylate transporter DctA [Proteobacteria bacterium]|jgi:aerobic C4-dicarboxylate transport protein|nr:C4-dicarboxylate transporter DctA [Pseudomonadota bacterium]MBK7115231.1 C4-dicarboxylate transporter DctA [Pseudomonadota bacterium]MCC6633813.1 C4-dicarboxylate transporter DctA [Gammaproteobacteria bacterium]
MRYLKLLYVQVLIAIVIGALLGHYAPDLGVALKPLGDGFIRLIRMLIAPIIFCTVVMGIAGMDNLRHVGRVGLYAIGYFEIVTTIALVVGLVVVNVLAPGAGMHVDPATLDTSKVAAYVGQAEKQGVVDFLLNIIPVSMFDAFAKGEILQVLLIALLCGFALQACGARVATLRAGIDGFSAILFRVVGYVTRLAPIGALGAMAFTIGSQGIGALAQLAMLMLCFYATCVLFVFGVLGLIARVHGFSIFRLIGELREELLIVLGTSSSESVLPRLMDKLEKMGCQRSVVGLVVPAGYSFNLDGTCIYLTMAAVFLAQATDTPMTLGQQLLMLGVLLLTSKGAAGVTGSGFIVLAGTLAAVDGPPLASLALILGIDRFMSEARALTNLVGNALATLVVSKWTGAWQPAPKVDAS